MEYRLPQPVLDANYIVATKPAPLAAMSGIDIALWDLRGKMAEMVFPAHPLMAELVKELLIVDHTGHIELSDRPDLGLELDPLVVARYRVTR